MQKGKDGFELRAHGRSRPPYPARKRRSAEDETEQLFKALIIVLVTIIGGMAFYIHRTSPKFVPPVPQVLPSDSPREVSSAGPARPIQRPSYAQQPQQYSEPAGPTDAQVKKYNTMQQYCYRMAQMNAEGEYPALQQAACGDFARFAQSIGLSTGQLPVVLVKQEAPRQAASNSSAANDRRVPPAECASLEQEKEQINAQTRQSHSSQAGEWYRDRLRAIDALMWDLNCRNH